MTRRSTRSPREDNPKTRRDATDGAGGAANARTADGSRAMARTLALGAALVALCLAAFWPALRAGFIWDDGLVYDNPLLRDPGGLLSIWTRPSAYPADEAHFWPWVYATFWLEFRLWGASPFGYHLVNILLHAANAVLLWHILRRLGVGGAWLAAAVFAVHPVHVESVAWIIERKDVLSALFYLLAFLAFLRFESRREGWTYAAALLLFGSAMWSKTIAATFPVALVIYLWWKRDRIEKRDILHVIPFFLIAIALGAIDVHIAHQRDAVRFAIPLIDRVLIASRSVWFYLGKVFFPANLATIYPRWDVEGVSAAWAIYPVGIVALLCGLWFARRRMGKGALAAVAFFIVTLGPILGFVDFYFMKYSFVADRFQYLASIGPIALAVLGLEWCLRRARRDGMWLRVTGAALVIPLAMLTWRQCGYYRNQESLFARAIEVNPDAWVARNNYGLALAARGEHTAAVEQFRRAVALRDDYAEAYNNLGISLYRLGELDGAVEAFSKAIEFLPDMAQARSGLATTLVKQKEYREAIPHFERALAVDPNDSEVLYAYGTALEMTGQQDAAIASYRAALRLRSGWLEARNDLATALARAEKYAEAAAEYESLVRDYPDEIRTRYNFAVALFRLGKSTDGVTQLEEILRRSPGHRRASMKLAWILSTAPDASIRDGERAVRLLKDTGIADNDPDPLNLDFVAAAYAEAGDMAMAKTVCGKAVSIARPLSRVMTADFVKHLESYEAGQPWREPMK